MGGSPLCRCPPQEPAERASYDAERDEPAWAEDLVADLVERVLED